MASDRPSALKSCRHAIQVLSWLLQCVFYTRARSKKIKWDKRSRLCLVDRMDRAILSVVSFAMALNRPGFVAVNVTLVSHVGKTGRRTVGRAPSKLQVPSPLKLCVPWNLRQGVWGAKPPPKQGGWGGRKFPNNEIRKRVNDHRLLTRSLQKNHAVFLFDKRHLAKKWLAQI